VPDLLMRLLRDDDGQDLAEYALLVAVVGLTGLAAWAGVQQAIASGYVAWDTAEQQIWEPPDPE
jgi:Flp pilus assembly pilin Flp